MIRRIIRETDTFVLNMRRVDIKSNRKGIITARAITVLFFILLQTRDTDATTNSSALFDHLFTDYQSAARPYCNNNSATNVRIDIALRQVVDLDEPSQVLTLNLWIRMFWTDCQLTWDPAAFGDLGNIVVPFKYMWVPDLTLYDSTADVFPGYDGYRVNIYSDGSVYYNFPTIIQSRCLVNVERFPYDTQTCSMAFGSWSYHGLEMDLVYKNPYGDLSTSVLNVEWNILKFTAERHVVYYGCCPEPYPDVTYYLKIERKPSFYIVNIIIPTFLITGMAILGFFLAVESGEKVSLQITVMLALAVFQLLVADSLPPSSDATPLISIYFNFCLFLVGFACVMAVLVLSIYYQPAVVMHRWVVRIFLGTLAKATWVYVPELNDHVKEPTRPESSSSEHIAYGKTRRIQVGSETAKVGTEQDEPTPKVQPYINVTAGHWKSLSKVVDRITCILFIIMGLCGTGIVFSKFTEE
ncbi:Neuronal acetylcholine receptor subunit alpha-10 [Mizuhopecten yessoensis]|uniref:Neuronal acetylcholine receptor subunit alpha-10 n=2 Tax=Mizuhopecten yessoensis TaxID=6573 RepID=A0A210PY29_MIZYE|nr:Neuronal acetylcholine receptor subunit alpha-10 [Mizuhopecten yessoensis]